MTNNEHNEKVLAEISKHQEAIEELKATIKPADEIQAVTLVECNAGMREAHFAKHTEKEAIKMAVAEAMSEGGVINKAIKASKQPIKAVKNESAKA